MSQDLHDTMKWMQARTGVRPRSLLCGAEFLIQIVRRSGSTETDSEILSRFKDQLTPDGCYELKAPS